MSVPGGDPLLAGALADPAVSDVLVVAGRWLWVERHGQLGETPQRLPPGAAEMMVERAIGPLGLRLDRLSPIVDARLPDGSRLHAVAPPVSVDGLTVAIRRFRPAPVELDAFAEPPVVELLRQAVQRGANVVISGGTGSGKTTLLGALARALPPAERVVTIEDAAELRLGLPHVVRLEARPATADGVGEVALRQLVRSALRLRPDRIVVGEVRGAEAIDLLAALNTGHDGTLATCHANSAADALRRLEMMVISAGSALSLAAVRAQIGAAVDVVVHVARAGSGARRIVEVAEVAPDGGGVRPLADGTSVHAVQSRAARRMVVEP